MAYGVSIGTACRQLSVSEKEVRAMMADGRLRYRRINGALGRPSHIIIDPSDIAREVLRARGGTSAATLNNTRLRAIFAALAAAALAKKPKRSYDILHSWTGQDLGVKRHFTQVCFTRFCKNVGS